MELDTKARRCENFWTIARQEFHQIIAGFILRPNFVTLWLMSAYARIRIYQAGFHLVLPLSSALSCDSAAILSCFAEVCQAFSQTSFFFRPSLSFENTNEAIK